MHGDASIKIRERDLQIMSKKLPVTHHPLDPISAAMECQIVSTFRLASALWQASAVHSAHAHNVQDSQTWHLASKSAVSMPISHYCMVSSCQRGHVSKGNCAFMLPQVKLRDLDCQGMVWKGGVFYTMIVMQAQ